MQTLFLSIPPIFGTYPNKTGEWFWGRARQLLTPKSQTAADRLKVVMTNYDVQSRVLTDVDEPGNVTIEDGVLDIEVGPYFFLWRDPNAADLFAIGMEATFTNMLIETAREAGELSDVAELQRRLLVLTERIENYEPAVASVDGAIEALRTDRQILHDVSPAVFYAVDKTAQYAALFRYLSAAFNGL